MERPNSFLKVMGVLYIIASSILIAAVLVLSVYSGALLDSVLGQLGVQSMAGGVMLGGIVFALCAFYMWMDMAAGVMAVMRGCSRACRVMAVFLLLRTAVNLVIMVPGWSSNAMGSTATVVSIICSLVFPCLYTIGAFMAPRVD